MKQFDLHRFGQALKCHFLVMRRTWIRLFAIYTLVMFMAELFFTRITYSSYDYLAKEYGVEAAYNTYSHIVEQAVVFGAVFFCFAMLFGASYLFSHMKTTPQRSAYLTWPVSNLEKYLIAFLHSVVLIAIGTHVAFFLADAMRVLVDVIDGRVVVWGTPMVTEATNTQETPGIFLAWILGVMLYFHSLYILGGSLFRRHQFLFTSIIIVIGFFLCVWGLNTVWLWFKLGDFNLMNWDNGIYHCHWILYVLVVLVYLLVAFHYWLSYKIFCRMQVINNKWLNV